MLPTNPPYQQYSLREVATFLNASGSTTIDTQNYITKQSCRIFATAQGVRDGDIIITINGTDLNGNGSVDTLIIGINDTEVITPQDRKSVVSIRVDYQGVGNPILRDLSILESLETIQNNLLPTSGNGMQIVINGGGIYQANMLPIRPVRQKNFIIKAFDYLNNITNGANIIIDYTYLDTNNVLQNSSKYFNPDSLVLGNYTYSFLIDDAVTKIVSFNVFCPSQPNINLSLLINEISYDDNDEFWIKHVPITNFEFSHNVINANQGVQLSGLGKCMGVYYFTLIGYGDPLLEWNSMMLLENKANDSYVNCFIQTNTSSGASQGSNLSMTSNDSLDSKFGYSSMTLLNLDEVGGSQTGQLTLFASKYKTIIPPPSNRMMIKNATTGKSAIIVQENETSYMCVDWFQIDNTTDLFGFALQCIYQSGLICVQKEFVVQNSSYLAIIPLP